MMERKKIIHAVPKIARSIAIASIGLFVMALPGEAATTNFYPSSDYHKLTIQPVKNEVNIQELLYGPAEFLFLKEPLSIKEDFEKPTPTPTKIPILNEILIPQESNVTVQGISLEGTIASGEIPDEVFDNLAQCESGQNWQENTGNGYLGGLQFSQGTWESVGGIGLPNEASRAEQIKRARILQLRSGWGQWPGCARKLGLLPNTS